RNPETPETDKTDYAAATSPGTEPSTHDSWTSTATHPFTGPCSKKTYPECTTHTNAAAFHASIWQDMGLSADACRLLHKIQSADAPSKLDDIFKQGVLDIPESIRLAHETSTTSSS
ncbi:hypothetical protein BIFPSEUDO_04503, partial [Bifidobacterium pseudocatenulatum DSM 20438 = JCM 1200 = LMG 10505]